MQKINLSEGRLQQPMQAKTSMPSTLQFEAISSLTLGTFDNFGQAAKLLAFTKTPGRAIPGRAAGASCTRVNCQKLTVR